MSDPLITFIVLGAAQPAGSKRAFVRPGKDGAKPRAVVTEDNERSMPWRQEVAAVAAVAMGRRLPFSGPIELRVAFARLRPKAHFKDSGVELNARGAREPYPTSKPDATKLMRGLEDALKGIVWKDDAQVVIQSARKVWGDRACTMVEIDLL